MDIPPIPTRAEADQFHALGHDLFNNMVTSLPPIIDAPMQTHGAAVGMHLSASTCNHPACMESRLDLLIATLAYAVVTEGARRAGRHPVDLSVYTAAEGGVFDA